MRRNFTFPNLFVGDRRVNNHGRTGRVRQMQILRTALVAASLALCGIPAGASRVASPLASVRKWVGSYAFTYTEHVSTIGTTTEIDKGTVSFTFFADGNGDMNGTLPIAYRGTAQAQSSYNATQVEPPCNTWLHTARAARTVGSDLYITSSGYNWSVNGLRAKVGGHESCNIPLPKHIGIGQLAHINFVPLPSGLVLCGSVDITRGKNTREHLTGHWAFYPEGHAQSAMLSGCPRVLHPFGTYISMRASKESRIGR